jgi:hypothetical protein
MIGAACERWEFFDEKSACLLSDSDFIFVGLQAAVILLNQHAVLSPILRCVVFGMPLLGFASPSERSMHLASAWEGSNRLAHFHFVLRYEP